MKLTAIIVVITCFSASAKSLAQSVTLSLKNVPLQKAFKEIKKQTGYNFLYTIEQLEQAGKVDVELKEVTLAEALTQCLKGKSLTFTIIDKTVIIKRLNLIQPEENKAISLIDIHGHIVNEKGEPVEGASVRVKGNKTKGTSSDANGNFELSGIDENEVLIISGVNIESFEIKINGRNTLNIIAKIAIGQNEDVIVKTNYWETRKKQNTGSINKITSSEIENQPVSNPLQAMQARTPGIYIQQANGVPGSNFNVTIRGRNSIANGNNPLYVIDGVPFISNGLSSTVTSANILGTGGLSPLDNLNPMDIESIEILKDADATAIYGSRGANGVILITTKKGEAKAGKVNIDFRVNTGISRVSRFIKLLNTGEYLDMRREAFSNDNITPDIYNAPDLTVWDQSRYTNWQKELIGKDASFTNAYLSVSGGNENTRYIFSNGYENQGTVFPGNLNNSKISSHLGLSSSSNDKKFNSVFSVSYTYNKNNLIAYDFTQLALTLPPDAPALYTSDGKLNWENSTWENPLSELQRKYNAITTNLIANATLSYKCFKDLELKTNLGFNDIGTKDMNLTPSTYYNPVYAATPEYAESNFNNVSFRSYIIEPQMAWNKNFSNSKIAALAGFTILNQKNTQQVLYGTGFSSDALIESIQAASTVRVISDINAVYKYTAAYGRLNYDYDGKYIFNATIRRDGSSRFGPGKQYGTFGAVGAAWLFSKESFFKSLNSVINYAKLRVSYGTTGNDQIGDYKYLDTYQSSGGAYQGVVGLSPTRLFNPDYAWEVNKKFEVGIELGLFSDRISIEADYFNNRSSNQLVNYPLPLTTGFTGVLGNLGATVQNTGLELNIQSLNITNKNFRWESTINLTIPRNKLVAFPGLAGSSYASRYVLGEPLSISKRYKFNGVDPQTGIFSFADMNGDGVISPDDRLVYKNIAQQFYGGFNNNITFKRFQLDFLIQFVRQQGGNYWNAIQLFPGYMVNQPKELLSNRWKTPGDEAKSTQIYTTGYNSGAVTAFYDRYTLSDATVSNASFLRLKTLSLSYELPRLIRKLNIKLMVQGQNLLTITNYFGLDPENAFAASLPPLKTFTGGIQLSF